MSLKIVTAVLLLLVIIRIIALVYIRMTIRKLLIKLITAFEASAVKYWVDFGSLLGIMREKDIILGDNDGDVCILESDFENVEVVRKIVELLGGQYFEWGAFRVFSGSIFIDIFLVKDTDETLIKYNDIIHPTTKRTVSLGGTEFVATLPHDPEQLLTKRYGNDWRTCLRKWYYLYVLL